jgi:SAM-dependent methyltransferase
VIARRTLLELAKSAVNALPARQRSSARRRLAAGYDSAKDSATYAASVYKRHSGRTGVRGRVLEIGPGGNVATAALYVKNGADSAVCIDSMPWVAGQDELYGALEVEEVLDRIEYLSPVTIEACDLPDESFDIIYSHATMEHVSDPEQAVRNVARMLRPGGVTSHQIDLRDHRDFADPLRFLQHSRRTWRLLTAGMFMPTNRWRASDFVEALERNGLRVTLADPTAEAEVTPTLRASFAPPFESKSLEDLAVLSVHVVATKDA